MSAAPAPPLPFALHVSADRTIEPDYRALPRRAGLLVFEDAAGRALTLAVTADLRRMARARLTGKSDEPSRRIDYRAITRCVRAVTVGSAFEADWAFLQLARRRIPERSERERERWRGWFVAADPDALHPQIVRTNAPAETTGLCVGPYADERTAVRAVEIAEDLFDLCRYPHILRLAPKGEACAYKEMGRCPAPCDGSFPLADYRRMIRDAMAFLADAAAGRRAIERLMREASAALDFEAAERCRRRFDASAPLDEPRFGHAGPLPAFRYLLCTTAEPSGHARLFLVAGGWIEPWADVPLPASSDTAADLLARARERLATRPSVPPAAAAENIGLVCRHLFQPSRSCIPLRADDALDARALAAALDALAEGEVVAERFEEVDEEA